MAKTKERILINFILDKSGSMGSVCDATISGVNEYLLSLKNDKKNKYDITLTMFDTEVTKYCVAQPMEDVKELDRTSYNPDGMTALYDAVCMTIKETEEKAKKNSKVLNVIMTDGEENSSKEYTQKEMKEKIEQLQKKNWTFVFLGANQDSWATAQKFGISQQNAANYNVSASGIKAVSRTLTSATLNYSSASQSDGPSMTFFSDKDQDSLSNA